MFPISLTPINLGRFERYTGHPIFMKWSLRYHRKGFKKFAVEIFKNELIVSEN